MEVNMVKACTMKPTELFNWPCYLINLGILCYFRVMW